MALNYFHTNRRNKAIGIINQIHKIQPSLEIHEIMDYIMADEFGYSRQDISHKYGKWWEGEDLNNKSIQIFCDQGIGDTILLLRYVYSLKEKYNVSVILNCYAYYEHLARIINQVPVEFVKTNKKCDYFTNIMTLPAILEGLDFVYPTEFAKLIKTKIPDQPKLKIPPINPQSDKPKVGIVWKSNKENELFLTKTIPDHIIGLLETEYWDLYELTPDEEKYNFVVQPELKDLYDTATWINSMDVIVSVDTCVLHLSGWLGVKAYGLLAFDCDPRWGVEDKNVWWSNQTMIRQKEDLDWEKPVLELRNKLIKKFCENL